MFLAKFLKIIAYLTQNTDLVDKREEVIRDIVHELTLQCQCTVEVSQIVKAGFVCFEQSPRTVTFRARIIGSQEITAHQLVELLEAWVASGATLAVQARLLNADKTCSVTIDSFSEQECQVGGTTVRGTSSTVSTTTSSSRSGSQTGNIPTIIGAAVVIIIVIIVIFIVVLIIVIVYKKKRQLDSKRYFSL